MPSPNRRNDDVARLRPFRDANKYAVNEADGRLYAVYSYRDTWPIYVFDRKAFTWYANEDRYSRTTSKHMTQCWPSGIRPGEFEHLGTQALIGFIENVCANGLAEVFP